MDHASLSSETVYYYFPKLCTAIFRSCVFLIANFCALLFADHTARPEESLCFVFHLGGLAMRGLGPPPLRVILFIPDLVGARR